jgi:hypothetical protein
LRERNGLCNPVWRHVGPRRAFVRQSRQDHSAGSLDARNPQGRRPLKQGVKIPFERMRWMCFNQNRALQRKRSCSSGRRDADGASRLVRSSWHAPIGPPQVGPTTARWGKEISSVLHEGFRVGRLFRAIVHCRHFPDVPVHGAADQPGCG